MKLGNPRKGWVMGISSGVATSFLRSATVPATGPSAELDLNFHDSISQQDFTKASRHGFLLAWNSCKPSVRRSAQC